MKFFKMVHYRNKENTLDIYFKSYTTKARCLKFKIEIYAAQTYNGNGFISLIANYNTSDNTMLNYIKLHNDFYLVEN